ncbi:MAG: hypothetical protein QM731_12420 [Chitinophagaceae bacterium]
MRRLLLFFICLFSITSAFTQQDLQQLINEGIALHDKQDYEGALKKYDEAIAIDKTNYTAIYEKSVTLMYMKKYDECVTLCKQLLGLDPKNELTKSVYVSYGSALDNSGDAKGAIKIFDKGIKQFPDYYLLYYNKGLTQNSLGEQDNALETMIKGLQCNPLHGSAHNAIAVIALQQHKIKALLPTIAFLAVEPQGQRATVNLKRMEAILNSNVKQKDEKNITISLSPDALDDKKSNGYGPVEMMMSLTSALDYDDKHKNETAPERLNRKLEMVVSSLKIHDKKKDPVGAFYTPFLADMKDKSMLETYCHLAYASTDDAANKQWIKDHTTEVDTFYQWLKAYQWGK